MASLETAKLAVKILNSKKGIDIKLIKIDGVSSISVSHIDGHRSDTWIVLDYVDVIVHVFSEEAREYYNLERLWQDGEEMDISDID